MTEERKHALSRPVVLLLFVFVLAIGAAYRFPGVTWGFDIETPMYVNLHPDEAPGCYWAMERGRSYLRSQRNELARGMQFQCYVLGLLFEPLADIKARAVVARSYSVLWGLLGILLVGLIAWRLSDDPLAGVFAAFLTATAGNHLVTSFWARGQIQNSTVFFATIYFALRSREAEKHFPWLFLAGATSGMAIAIRWSVALGPMLFCLALSRPRAISNLLVIGAGALTGFCLITGFQWTPELIAIFIRLQSGNLVNLYSRVGPHITAAAALVSILAGTGLVTFALAVWFGIERLRSARFRRPVRSDLGSPLAIVSLPFLTQFVLVSIIKAYDARYTDLFAPALAIPAGLMMAALLHRFSGRIIAPVLGLLLLYQAIYAAGVLDRYTNDARGKMNAALPSVWKPKGTIYATPYVTYSSLYDGHGVRPGGGPWDAEWVVAADVYAGQYRTPSGTFLALGGPTSCREVLYCDGERHRRFYQALYAEEGWELVHVADAADWTPEMKLHEALMGSKWLFTGDVRLFRVHARTP